MLLDKHCSHGVLSEAVPRREKASGVSALQDGPGSLACCLGIGLEEEACMPDSVSDWHSSSLMNERAAGTRY